jgi:hypothetical protein
MSTAENVYAPTRVLSANDIPAGVLNYLNGEDLLSKTQALRLTTVDADGWPKAALLTPDDVLALPNGRFLRISDEVTLEPEWNGHSSNVCLC